MKKLLVIAVVVVAACAQGFGRSNSRSVSSPFDSNVFDDSSNKGAKNRKQRVRNNDNDNFGQFPEGNFQALDSNFNSEPFPKNEDLFKNAAFPEDSTKGARKKNNKRRRQLEGRTKPKEGKRSRKERREERSQQEAQRLMERFGSLKNPLTNEPVEIAPNVGNLRGGKRRGGNQGTQTQTIKECNTRGRCTERTIVTELKR